MRYIYTFEWGLFFMNEAKRSPQALQSDGDPSGPFRHSGDSSVLHIWHCLGLVFFSQLPFLPLLIFIGGVFEGTDHDFLFFAEILLISSLLVLTPFELFEKYLFGWIFGQEVDHNSGWGFFSILAMCSNSSYSVFSCFCLTRFLGDTRVSNSSDCWKL